MRTGKCRDRTWPAGLVGDGPLVRRRGRRRRVLEPPARRLARRRRGDPRAGPARAAISFTSAAGTNARLSSPTICRVRPHRRFGPQRRHRAGAAFVAVVPPTSSTKTIAVNLKGPLRINALSAEHMPAGRNRSSHQLEVITAPDVRTPSVRGGQSGLTASPSGRPTSSPRGHPGERDRRSLFHTPCTRRTDRALADRWPPTHLCRIASAEDRRHRALPRERRLVPDRAELNQLTGGCSRRTTHDHGVTADYSRRKWMAPPVRVSRARRSYLGSPSPKRLRATARLSCSPIATGPSRTVVGRQLAPASLRVCVGVDVSDPGVFRRAVCQDLGASGRVDVRSHAGVSTFNMIRVDTPYDWAGSFPRPLGVVHGPCHLLADQCSKRAPAHVVNTARCRTPQRRRVHRSLRRDEVWRLSRSRRRSPRSCEGGSPPIGVSVLGPSCGPKVMYSVAGRPAGSGRAPHRVPSPVRLAIRGLVSRVRVG